MFKRWMLVLSSVPAGGFSETQIERIWKERKRQGIGCGKGVVAGGCSNSLKNEARLTDWTAIGRNGIRIKRICAVEHVLAESKSVQR